MKNIPSKTGSKPEKIILGNVTVKIYHRVRGGKYHKFELADYSKGFRQLRSFSDHAEARNEALKIARQLSTGETTAATMRNSDAASYGRAIELLRPTSVSLELSAAHYAEAFKILGGDRIIEAAKDFMRRNPVERRPRTVRQVADELIELKTKRNVIKQKKVKLSEDEKDLFAAIELGADDFIENDPQTAKWRFDDAGKIAYSLLTYILRARGNVASSLNYGSFGMLAKKYLKRDFCDENASDWWNFAKEIFLFSYPEPHTIDELNQLVPVASGKRKTTGRLKQAILDKLKARFLSFAQNPY